MSKAEPANNNNLPAIRGQTCFAKKMAKNLPGCFPTSERKIHEQEINYYQWTTYVITNHYILIQI